MNTKSNIRFLNRILLLLLAFLFCYFIWRCPFKLIFKIPCPGCGMTRALSKLLIFDFKSAIAYHPLCFLAPIFALFIFFREKLNISEKVQIIVAISIFVLLIFVWIYRLINTNIINFL